MPTPEVLWTPPADVRDHTRIGHYLHWLEQARGLRFDTYDDLWRWSVTDLPGFWSSMWEYMDVPAHTPFDQVLRGESIPDTTWFPGATLNYAEQMLRLPDRSPDDVVVVGRSQTRGDVDLTAEQLRDLVGRARAGLLRLGVGRDDRVAAYLPNIPETVVLLLATASLGAVFSSCAPEFGTRSVTDRWRQIEPKVLVTVDGYRYGDKAVDRADEVAAIRQALPKLEHTVVLPYLGPADRIPNATDWSALVAEAGAPECASVDVGHPLYVLYSSGTTGLPKPIVHGHGGILVEHLKMLALHHDLGPRDRFFWFSTTGWMMWNFLVSGLGVGATVVLFDGNPGWPDLNGLWRLAAETRTTYFGTSAPFLLACRKAGLEPMHEHDLSALRGVGSTGAPLPAEGFRWVYEHLGKDLVLASLSGGTDLCTGFLGGSPLLPVTAGEIACRALGADVHAFDESGEPVIGEQGELVITSPMPSMPVGFWGDTDGSRYRAAYFEDFPGVWRHGDWLTVTDRGTCLVTGRSDATLNRGGVRLGTSEFYSMVEGLPEVADSLVVHLEDDAGGAGELLLFVVPSEGDEVDDTLQHKIRQELRRNLSPRHVPDAIHGVAAVPRTLSGKKLEVPVKKILRGASVDDAASRGAMANPECLDAYADLATASRAGR